MSVYQRERGNISSLDFFIPDRNTTESNFSIKYYFSYEHFKSCEYFFSNCFVLRGELFSQTSTLKTLPYGRHVHEFRRN